MRTTDDMNICNDYREFTYLAADIVNFQIFEQILQHILVDAFGNIFYSESKRKHLFHIYSPREARNGVTGPTVDLNTADIGKRTSFA